MYKAVTGVLPEVPESIEEPFKSIIIKSWSLGPRDRPTFNDIFEELSQAFFHFPSVKEYVEEIQNKASFTREIIPIDDELEKPFPSSLALTESLWTFHKDLTQLDDLRLKFIVKPFEHRIPFFTNLRTLLTLKHPCIIGFVGFTFPTDTNSATVITEYAEHQSLEDCFLPELSDTLIGKIILGIVLGMQFMHASQMIHGNLVPSNILLDSHWRPRISDFTKSQRGVTSSELKKNDVLAFTKILRKLLVKGRTRFPETRERLEKSVKGTQEESPLPPIHAAIYDWERSPLIVSFDDVFGCLQAQDFKILPNCDSNRLSAFVQKIRDWETAFLANYKH
jgi:hypothetical protein